MPTWDSPAATTFKGPSNAVLYTPLVYKGIFPKTFNFLNIWIPTIYRYGWVCFFDQWQRYYYPVLFLWSYLRLLCGTKFLRVLIFSIFAVFPAIRKNMFPQIRITANSFPAKIYCRLNILLLEFATQRYSTKKSCLLNHNLSKTTKYLFIF